MNTYHRKKIKSSNYLRKAGGPIRHDWKILGFEYEGVEFVTAWLVEPFSRLQGT